MCPVSRSSLSNHTLTTWAFLKCKQEFQMFPMSCKMLTRTSWINLNSLGFSSSAGRMLVKRPSFRESSTQRKIRWSTIIKEKRYHSPSQNYWILMPSTCNQVDLVIKEGEHHGYCECCRNSFATHPTCCSMDSIISIMKWSSRVTRNLSSMTLLDSRLDMRMSLSRWRSSLQNVQIQLSSRSRSMSYGKWAW